MPNIRVDQVQAGRKDDGHIPAYAETCIDLGVTRLMLHRLVRL
jgi:hypothetical protein